MDRSIRSVNPPRWTEVVPGASVSRPFPKIGLRTVDPFLMIDHGPPRVFRPGEKIHVPPHPHRGFSPVSLLFSGEVEHKDSMGHHGIVRSGGVQWMTAGAGVVHEEILRPENREEGGLLHAAQLWVNLPAEKKWIEPSYQNVQAEDIPTVWQDQERVSVRIITGEIFGERGPIQTYSPMLIMHVQMESDSEVRIPVPHSYNALTYVLEGSVQAEGQVAEAYEMVLYEQDGDFLSLSTKQQNNLLVLAGEPLDEPVVFRGPFVMNTEEEAQQAYVDYQMGRMGHIPAF